MYKEISISDADFDQYTYLPGVVPESSTSPKKGILL